MLKGLCPKLEILPEFLTNKNFWGELTSQILHH